MLTLERVASAGTLFLIDYVDWPSAARIPRGRLPFYLTIVNAHPLRYISGVASVEGAVDAFDDVDEVGHVNSVRDKRTVRLP